MTIFLSQYQDGMEQIVQKHTPRRRQLCQTRWRFGHVCHQYCKLCLMWETILTLIIIETILTLTFVTIIIIIKTIFTLTIIETIFTLTIIIIIKTILTLTTIIIIITIFTGVWTPWQSDTNYIGQTVWHISVNRRTVTILLQFSTSCRHGSDVS